MRRNRVLLIGCTIGLCSLILSGCNSSGKMAEALETQDINEIYEVYNKAADNDKLLSQYDEVIGEYIEQITSDLNDFDFDEDGASEGSQAVYDYASTYWNNLMIVNSDNSLYYIIDSATMDQWDYLQEIVQSKMDYCDALYFYKTEQNYEDAIQYFQLVTKNDSVYDKIEDLITECADTYVDSLEYDCTTESEAKEALADMSELQVYFNQCNISSVKIENKIVSYVDKYIEIVLAEVDKDITNGDINAGIQRLESAEEYLEGENLISSEIESKMEEVLTAYAEEYAEKAASLFAEHDVAGAVGNIEVAIELQPDNAEYASLKDTYEQYYPFELYDKDNLLFAEKIDLGKYDFITSITGNDNNEYMNIIEIGRSGSGSRNTEEILEFTYNLGGNYDSVTGTILVPKSHKNYEQSTYFEAYGDGTLLYTSPVMSPGTLPQNISFNVSGVQSLMFKFYTAATDSYHTRIDLSNLVAQKAFPE